MSIVILFKNRLNIFSLRQNRQGAMHLNECIELLSVKKFSVLDSPQNSEQVLISRLIDERCRIQISARLSTSPFGVFRGFLTGSCKYAS